MKLAECKKLKIGDKIKVHLGNGWYQEAEFNGMLKRFGTMTIGEALNFDFSKGGTQMVEYVYYDEDGKKRTGVKSPRCVQKI